MNLERKVFEDIRDKVLLSQYSSATNLHVLLEAIIDVLDEDFFAVLRQIDGFPDPFKLSGYPLDLLGTMIDLGRPFLAFVGTTSKFFGFDSATGYSPGGFGTLMADKQTIRDQISPISDTAYRILLRARMKFLVSKATYRDIDDIAKSLETPGITDHTRLTVTAANTYLLTLTIEDGAVKKALTNKEFTDRIFPFPPLADYSVTFTS